MSVPYGGTKLTDARNRLVEAGLLDVPAPGSVSLHSLFATYIRDRGALDDGAPAEVERALLAEADRLITQGDTRSLLLLQPDFRLVTDEAEQRRDDAGASRLCHAPGSQLQMLGNYALARHYFERAVTIRQADRRARADSLDHLGVVLTDAGEYAAARQHLDDALAICEGLQSADRVLTASVLNHLGSLLYTQGDGRGARDRLQRAPKIREDGFDTGDLSIAETATNLARVLRDEWDEAGALPYLEQALRIRREVLRDEHPDTAESLNNLGLFLAQFDHFDEGLQYLQQALDIRHPEAAATIHNLGYLHMRGPLR